MLRFCCGCCLSGKKHKSFPIHEKQRETEVTKVFIRHVENIRVTPPPINRKTISKATIKKKSDDTKVNCGTQKQTMKEKNAIDSRIPASKLFRKSKKLGTPSPLPMAVGDITEEVHNKTLVNAASSCSSSTNSDPPKQNKNSQHRSYGESYGMRKENSTLKKNGTQSKKVPIRNKSPAKSKLVLENVRKMIQDQNIQQQYSIHSQQKESARL